MSFFLSLVGSPIASGVEADSPKNSLHFWVFSDLVIAALENYLYCATLSFISCRCRKSIQWLRKLRYITQAAVDVHKKLSLEIQHRFFLIQKICHLVSTAYKLQSVCKTHNHMLRNMYIMGTLYAII